MTGALIPLLLALAADDGREASYQKLVAQGVAQGRQGQLADARRALDQAVALDPQAPAAWRERGGLHFLRRDYPAAARDFDMAWQLAGDEYSGRMLGTSLHLAGRPEEALDAWNRVGLPRVRTVRIQGADDLPDAMVRREISAVEGELLTAGQLRESRLRLEETDSFGRVSLRPVPLPDGAADLDVHVADERGVGGTVEFLGRLGTNVIGEKIRLQYRNLVPGLTPGVYYKWEDTQPQLRGTLLWVRPLGLDANLAFTGVAFYRPQYALDGPLQMRSSGFDLAARRVVGPDTVAEVGFRTRTRTFTRPRPDTPEGRWSGLEAGVEHRFLGVGRHRADGALRLFHTADFLGSDLRFGQGLAWVRYRALVAGDDGTAMPGTELAARILAGWSSGGTPLDVMFAPGAASEMDFPVRGHRQKRNGVLGRSPIGRSLGLLNLEWRQRLVRFGSSAALGGVVFYDAARVAATAEGPDRTLHDVGAGLRLRVGNLLLRADYGTSLTDDGNNALTVGFGHVF